MAVAASEVENARQPPGTTKTSIQAKKTATSPSNEKITPASEKITPADLKLLQSNPSAETRSLFAAKFGRQYDAFAATSSKEFADTILYHLAKDVEVVVRQALAETIAESPNMPKALAMDLAGDAIEIARPILERSEALEDENLTQIVGSQTGDHAFAIAGRRTVSEPVTDALIASDYADAILRLLTNDGALFTHDGLLRLATDFGGHFEIQDLLVKRANLPPEVVDRLIDGIGEALKWDLLKNRSIEPTEARHLASALKGKTGKAIAKRDANDQATTAKLQERMAQGLLKPLDILYFLQNGHVGRFESALAVIANIELLQTRRLLYNMDKRGLAALCLHAGLGTPQYMAVRMALDLADMGIGEMRARSVKYPAKTARFVQDQYERLRTDKKTLGQFLRKQ